MMNLFSCSCGCESPLQHSMSRRNFLCSSVLGGLVAATPPSLWGSVDYGAARAQGQTVIKATHGTGLCNLGMFLVKERNLGKDDGVIVDFVNTPSNADITMIFGAGIVNVSMLPYSFFLTLYGKGVPIKIIAGGGVAGNGIVGSSGITSQETTRGKALGTVQADTLEVLPYDWLKKAGMSLSDVDVRYFGTSPELAQAFIAGSVDWLCHIEPYATQALQGREGATLLSNGTDIYGPNYSDCVLAAYTGMIKDSRPALKGLIKALMIAQKQTEEDREAALKETLGKYYKADLETVLAASEKQPVAVDQRGGTKFVIERSQSMVELGYLEKPIDENAFDWSILEQVIGENKDLYDSLRVKT